MAFGALLRRLRIEAGLSQAALAEAAGISASAIGAYEQGVHASPHRETIRLIAEALHLDAGGRLALEQAGRRPAKPGSMHAARDLIGNLPLERSSFVGRSDEIRDTARLIGQHRLVTIVGPGGVGKTRLAQRVAADESAKRADGNWFFDFAAIEHPEFVLSTIAAVLGVQAQSADGLASSMRSKRMLLVFDNCEHLVERVSEIVAAFLRRCPDITILATSRASLRMAGETVLRLSPLAVPIAGASSDAIMGAEAIALFVERASAADSSFHPTADDAPTIADICRNLDGLPLAIEIASMRVPLIGLRALRDQIATVMSSKVPIRDLPARQQTLERTLDWSLALLDQTSQSIFYLLSIFVGGCSIEAAQFVCGRSGIGSSEAIDGILQLSEASLINADLDATSVRYTMHAMTYALARRRLEQSERFGDVVRAHGDWLVSEAERYGRHTAERMTRKRWHQRFDPEIDNLRAALQNGIQGKLSARTVSVILSEFSPIWEDLALLIEYRRWISDATPVVCADNDPETRASFDFAKAMAALPQDELSSYERAIQSSRAAGGKKRRLTSLTGLFARAYGQTEVPFEKKKAEFDRAFAVMRECGEVHSTAMAIALLNYGLLLSSNGENGRPSILLAVDIATELNEEYVVLHAQNFLAEDDERRGDLAAGIERLTLALEMERCVSFPRQRMYLLANRAGLLLSDGQVDRALADAEAGLAMARDGDQLIIPYFLQQIAAVAAHKQNGQLAAILAGHVNKAFRESNNDSRSASELALTSTLNALVRELLPTADAERFRTMGEAMTSDEAVVFAINARIE